MLNILLATNGEPGALGAVRMAARLAERKGARVTVLVVFEPVLVYPPGPLVEGMVHPSGLLEPAVAALETRVREQLDGVGGAAAAWEVTLESGSAGPVIAQHASSVGADLVLVGLRSPGRLESWVSRESVVRLLHLASVPVLAVPPETTELPHRAVVAIDFAEHSIRAARGVAAVMPVGGELHLAHVTWSPPTGSGWSEPMEWVETYRAGVEQRLQEMARVLAEETSLRVRYHLLHGNPGPELLQLTHRLEADLLVAGSHGAGFFGRFLLGGVSSRLVHGSPCALFISPPPRAGTEPVLTRDEVLAQLGTGSELALAPRVPLPATRADRVVDEQC